MAVRRWIFVAALGAVTSALLGSGLLAVVVDAATSEGNSIQSGALAPPPADLRAGIITAEDDCGAATTTNEVTFAAAVATTDFAPTAGNRLYSERICLYNAGASDGWMQMQFANVLDREENTVAGTCDNAEGDPFGGNDTTCGENDPGELSDVMTLNVEYVSTGGGGCESGCTTIGPPTYRFDDVAATPLQLVKLAPGEAISFYVHLRVSCCDESDQQMDQAAQTDFLQWDITFSALDEEPIQ
jgi:hypothetical protein